MTYEDFARELRCALVTYSRKANKYTELNAIQLYTFGGTIQICELNPIPYTDSTDNIGDGYFVVEEEDLHRTVQFAISHGIAICG